MKDLYGVAQDVMKEVLGEPNPPIVGKYYQLKDKPVKITGGSYMGSYGRISNFWSWRTVNPDGSLKKHECSGYDNGEHGTFYPITKEKAITLAKRRANGIHKQN